MLTRTLHCVAALMIALPCLWDRDTLDQELSRFPTALELITGRFPRHSREFYEWRIEDREQSLKAGVISAEYLDDLAVAHSKLGEDARAIELMAQKERDYPDLYTTAANLGTFHIHAGNHEEGLTHIQRAILINPDAHFGREIYQALLVEYVIAKKGDSESLPMPLDPDVREGHWHDGVGFWKFLKEKREISEQTLPAEVEKAMVGVLGMMRFGNHDSPVLLEALSDLLLANPDPKQDGKLLAARALLKASYEVEGETARAAYRKKAEVALETQTPDSRSSRNIELAAVEASFKTELTEADFWWSKLRENELNWIATGDDVDARFAETYHGATKRTRIDSEARKSVFDKYGKIAAAAIILIAVAYMAALPRRS